MQKALFLVAYFFRNPTLLVHRKNRIRIRGDTMRPLVILAAALLGVLFWAKATEAYAVNGVFIIACIAAGLLAFGIAEFLFSLRIKALNAENQQLSKNLTTLENEVTQVRKNRLESSNSNVAALENYNKQLAQLQAENQQLETERRQIRDRFTKMSEDLANLENIAAEKLKVQQALDDARQNIAELTNDNERLRLDLQMLHAELAPKIVETEEAAAASLVESLTTDDTPNAPSDATTPDTPEVSAENVAKTEKTEKTEAEENVVAAILEEAQEGTSAQALPNLERSLEMASLAAITEQVEDADPAPPTDASWRSEPPTSPTLRDTEIG